jgi:hypothetical protein
MLVVNKWSCHSSPIDFHRGLSPDGDASKNHVSRQGSFDL